MSRQSLKISAKYARQTNMRNLKSIKLHNRIFMIDFKVDTFLVFINLLSSAL